MKNEKCLSVDKNNQKNEGAHIIQTEFINDPLQLWSFENISPPYYKIINKATKQCISLDSANIEGCRVYQWSWVTPELQLWKIVNY